MNGVGSPRLSLVVYAREVPRAFPDSLASIAALDMGDELEVILADATPDGRLLAARSELPGARYLDCARATMPAARAEAAHAARGEVVAFVGAAAVVGRGWGEEVLRAFAAAPRAAAVGGPVRWTGGGRPSDLAAYLFEYGAFHPPLSDGPTAGDLPGINVAYLRRSVTGLCGDLLARHGFYKPMVHARLREAGHTLELRSTLEVELRDEHRFSAFAAKRFRYGRCFGGLRTAEESPRRRRRLRLLAPLVPALLVARHLFRAARHPRQRRWLPVAAGPLAGICLAWGLGEWLGIWRGAGSSCEALS
jgi:hypothetical protein